MAEYVLYNQRCGHVGLIDNYRRICEAARRHLASKDYHNWRIRVGASDEDVASLLRQDCCDGCRTDTKA